jgi:hypothetical protein
LISVFQGFWQISASLRLKNCSVRPGEYGAGFVTLESDNTTPFEDLSTLTLLSILSHGI